MAKPTGVPAQHPLQFDSASEFAQREAHVRAQRLYMTVELWLWMLERWGGLVLAVKTISDKASGNVTMFRADPDEADATKVLLSPTERSAEVSFGVPLRKLGLKTPRGRQFVVEPYEDTVGGELVFIFPMARRRSVAVGQKVVAPLADGTPTGAGEGPWTKVAATKEDE